MLKRIRRRFRAPRARALAWVLIVSLLTTPADADVADDDLFLFTTSVPPNVMILLDNSGSMNHLVWHPQFDPTQTYDCAIFDPAVTYGITSDTNVTACGVTRKIYHDTSSVGYTRIDGRYLNWYFSSSNTYMSEINDNNNGTRACSGPGSPTYARYQRNRMSAAKQVVLDTICRVEATKSVRFGLSVFREPRDVASLDPNGGYAEVGIDDNTPAHASDLEASIANTVADSWTPLGEALYQMYTYFMSRDPAKLPDGLDGNPFPVYSYSRSPSDGGGKYDTSGPPGVPKDPIEYSCQKNFIIVITDGVATKDDFDADPASTAAGFTTFGSQIGDYNADGQVEEPGDVDESAFYLDDIARYMNEYDFRPDWDNDQTLDTYTIGFTTEGVANDLLRKTADQGNGLFFTSNNAEELTAAIASAITDIIEKSQSFTAATVPSTRTAEGGSFFTSFFLPSGKTPFWEGHLKAYSIDAAGDIFDRDGNCALIDPDPGECNSGPFLSTAEPFWDAGAEVPLPGSRTLYTVRESSGVASRISFNASTITNEDLTILPFTTAGDPAPNPIYPGSNAQNEDGLTMEIVSNVRGCQFPTGVSGPGVTGSLACIPRPWRLGDIFHSNPQVVAGPKAAIAEPSYQSFRSTYATRQRIIYAGANDGFLHAFDAGSWDTSLIPDQYTRGDGSELFGFMPWEVRQNIKNLPIDAPDSRHYYVDGSPTVADVWMYPSATAVNKAASEWKSILIGGLRQGGRAFFALDVTNPADSAFPGYLWEWPRESDPDDPSVATSFLPYLGESWSTPVITKVKVKVDSNDNGGAGFERWVAILTGGYHVESDPNKHAEYSSSSLKGRSIVILDIASGKPLAVKKFNPSASSGDPEGKMEYGIPATPAVFDLDYDGFADVIYAGDLGGQVFKWSIHAIGEDRVNDSSVAGDWSQPNWPFKLFFSAPITGVSGTDYYKSFFFPASGTFFQSRLWIALGSGERNNLGFEGFPTRDENNRFYAFNDPDPFETSSPAVAAITESDLTDVTNDASCPSVASRGFYFKAADGEKFVTNSDIFLDHVFVGSFIPTLNSDPCTSKGDGALYIFSIGCGQGTFTDANGDPTRRLGLDAGLPTDPKLSIGVDGKDNRIYIEKSGADLESIGAPDMDTGTKTLLYWRELP